MKQEISKKMGIEGVGPQVMVPAAIIFIVALIVSYVYRPTFDMTFIPREITLALAAIFLVIGIPIWLAGVVYFLLAYRKGEMATGGAYALMPNPIYSSWTVFVFPGIAFLLNWWLLLATPIVMYASFRYFIKHENSYMRQKYGKQYEEYMQKVMLKFL